MRKMMNYVKQQGLAISAVVSALALTLVTNASAAVDADFATTSTAIQGLVTDNKTVFIGLLIALVVALFGITLAKGALVMGLRWISRGFFGGRKKR